MKISSILGLNARSQLYLSKNMKAGKKIADSKIATFRVMKASEVPTPQIYKKFRNPKDIFDFNWESLPNAFALKPSRGLGGEGIVVVKKRSADKTGWITTGRIKVTSEDLKLHILDILEGAYSIGNVPDVAFVQEYVGRHNAFRKYSYRGTPDIRVIVFNKVPVMAMLRLPTKESGGRANLFQGAIAAGIDIATGITTRAIWHGDIIKYKPETNRKLNGIKIPNWTQVLETAVRGSIAANLNYAGIDIVLHPEKGPMILELNAQPGLKIQLANMAGLKKRLERVEDLNVRDAEHGVKIAKALFAERFTDRVAAEEGIKKISVWEEIKIIKKDKTTFPVFAKIDTGAWRTSVDKDLAEELGLLKKENILWNRKVRTSNGTQERPVVNLSFYLAGRKVKTTGSITKRSHLRVPMIIGRRDLVGFMVSSTYQDRPASWVPPMWKSRKT